MATPALGRVGAVARRLGRYSGQSRWRWRLALDLAGLSRHRLGSRRGAGVLAASGLSGLEGGVLGALAIVGAHPSTALTAVLVYRVAGYWAPGAAGAVMAALLTRRHPARQPTRILGASRGGVDGR